ncbi:RICIN domain-containing protein [Kitasatospora sp. NPDC056783]|uniref:RICIN domain-containing protein n=1 Tax=Kitasatospora sp. NPDC056783 TaxID=3345943 RepID=UPI00369C49F9
MTSNTAHPVRRPAARSAGAARAVARAVRTAVATVAAVVLLAAPAVADTGAGTGAGPVGAPRALSGHDWKGWICDGYFRINTPTAGMVLEYDVASDNKAVLQRPWRGADTQQWEVCHWPGPLETADYILKSKVGGDCVTLWGSYQQEGYWFSVFDCERSLGQNQKFWISRDPGSDKVMFQVLHSGMWMAIQGPFAGNGSHVSQYLNRATAFSLQGI